MNDESQQREAGERFAIAAADMIRRGLPLDVCARKLIAAIVVLGHERMLFGWVEASIETMTTSLTHIVREIAKTRALHVEPPESCTLAAAIHEQAASEAALVASIVNETRQAQGKLIADMIQDANAASAARAHKPPRVDVVGEIQKPTPFTDQQLHPLGVARSKPLSFAAKVELVNDMLEHRDDEGNACPLITVETAKAILLGETQAPSVATAPLDSVTTKIKREPAHLSVGDTVRFDDRPGTFTVVGASVATAADAVVKCENPNDAPCARCGVTQRKHRTSYAIGDKECQEWRAGNL